MVKAFDLIVVTPPGLLDPSLAIAASRAGELGVLDLEYIPDATTVLQAAATLARYARTNYGLKLNCRQGELLVQVISQAPEQLHTVLLTGHDAAVLRQHVEALQRHDLRVLLEVTSLEQARLGAALGVNGLVAKGNEAGGRVGEETTFVLLQACLQRVSLPVYAHGGIGLHTAAACYAAGAAGAVLDMQLALTRESGLPLAIKEHIATMDGSETICLGGEIGVSYRLYSGPGLEAVDALRRAETQLGDSHIHIEERQVAWDSLVRQRVGWEDARQNALLLGQDAALAAPFARRFGTVGGVLTALHESITAHCEAAVRLRPLDEGAPLAQSHRTRYPIVQGPMTRVSDNPAFAHAVAQAGGLPLLALALMGKDEAGFLLEHTRQQLGERPWGVGILGFVPPAVRQGQLEAVQAARPTFAIIAGGRPDQARILEQAGIPTYLHVPSPGLLRMFLADGACRFIFEGRECGGHVGPRSSFVLWEMMTEVLLEHLALTKADAQQLHILFAGGIHDACSAAMVAALAAPLADLGARIGVLMGTAYIFTHEAVATGAIVPAYQDEVLRSGATILLESGLGHVTRCLPTAFAQTFAEKRRQLLQAQISGERLREELEALNLGRLRVASKGITRSSDAGQGAIAPKYVALDEAAQRAQGMYMIGQVAALHDQTCTIADLHWNVSVAGSARLAALAEPSGHAHDPSVPAQPSRIAIIGMACILPGAPQLQTYWEHILAKVDAITEVPRDRWDWQRFFDPDPSARDKIYSRWGGFIDEIPFNPLDYGMPPSSVPMIEPMQLLMLEVVRAGLVDAGYAERPFPRERTAALVAVGGGLGDLGYLYGFRSYLPHFLDAESSEVIARLADRLPEWTEDSFPGILLNVVAGRVANRFDLGGPNFTVDAACGSSLAAIDVAIKDLEAHHTDMAIVGAGDTVQSPFAFLAFSKTHALSPTGRCRPFDAQADGIAISEGLAVVVLKRLADAERDGDRIYAVIDGVGASSDGRDRGLTAPRAIGQLRALRRAYAKAGYVPSTVSLIEAHGTGTRVGDLVELAALSTFFQAAQSAQHTCALGSVKSMIGHTKSTAGLAGLIKVALALYHQTLPPTLVDQLNPKLQLADSPFYVNDAARPWLTGSDEQIRRAGVSAFGFGGTNFHVALEEYRDSYLTPQANRQSWPAELLLWRGEDRASLLRSIEKLETWLAAGNTPPLSDLAYTLYQRYRQSDAGPVLAIVATSLDDLKQKVAQARAGVGAGGATLNDGIAFFDEQILGKTGKIAFLFAGQGSQYPDMLSDLVLQFPLVRACFERANRILQGRLPRLLSEYVFPAPSHSEEGARADREALTATRIAQPALGATEVALSSLLQELGVQPDMVAGHSYGEIVALWRAGVLSEGDLFTISEARGRFMAEVTGSEAGTMAAVRAGRAAVADMLAGMDHLTLANLNAPTQTVISGPRAAVEQAVQRFQAHGIGARILPVACAFHSPLVEPAREQLAALLETIAFTPPQLAIFSNTTASQYPELPEAIRALLSDHLARPVEFQREIEALYAHGARVFLEVGPQNVLSGLVGQILEGKAHLVVAVDRPGVAGLMTLQKALGQLAAAGVPVRLEPLYTGRTVARIDLDRPYQPPDNTRYGPTTWLVNGGRARLWRDAQRGAASILPPLKVQLIDEAAAPRRGAEGSASEHHVAPPATTLDGAGSHHAVPPMEQAAVPAPAPGELAVPPGDDVGQVMIRYQQLISRFLETQQNIMLAYLGDTPATAAQQAAHVSQPDPAAMHPSHITNGAADPAPTPATASGAGAQARGGPAPATPEPAPGASEMQEPHDSQLDAATLTRALLLLVSERTGYPPDMLDLDADLEADLGIDSIKRVEILDSFRRSRLPLEQALVGQALEDLQSKRTLRAIVTWIVAQVTEASAANGRSSEPRSPALALTSGAMPPPAAGEAYAGEAVHGAGIGRFTLLPVETPLPGATTPLPPNRLLLITDDGQGIARTVADRLRSQGHRVVLMPQRNGVDATTADLADPVAARTLLDTIRRQHGPIDGLLHLAPLGEQHAGSTVGSGEWRAAISSLFSLIQLLHDDLVAAARSGGAYLLAATGMSGTFAAEDDSGTESFSPSRAGIAGLLKTAAHELPSVRIKAVDLNLRQGAACAAAAILQELAAHDGVVEVGYDGDRRRVLRMAPLPSQNPDHLTLPITSRSVILITGGARGITGQVALDLAVRYQPTLVLAGRSALPAPEETAQTAGLTTAQAIKAALIASLSQNGRSMSLAEVEAAYNRLLREREMRANLAALRQAGATVHYAQVDVRDEALFGALIDDLYRTYGRLDGVIHGAGVIEDKLIKDKTVESFERVVSTKADSALILSRRLRPETLSFLVFFSSVSGRFGNRGQSDYAAANELLNAFARYLDRRWPARVVSISWGPWDVGMVSPELRREFTRRGVSLIPTAEGCRRLIEELRCGCKGEAEVLICGADAQVLAAPHPSREPASADVS